MTIFRAPAAVHALLQKRKLAKLKQEAVARDFPEDAEDRIMEGALLYQDPLYPDELFQVSCEFSALAYTVIVPFSSVTSQFLLTLALLDLAVFSWLVSLPPPCFRTCSA